MQTKSMSLCLSAALGYLTGRNVSANAIGDLRGCTVPHSHAFWLFLEPRLFWFAVKCQYCFCISSPPIKWHVPLQPDDIALLKPYACINIRAAEEKCLRSRGSMHQSANLLTLKMEGSEVQSPAAREITEHMWAYVCTWLCRGHFLQSPFKYKGYGPLTKLSFKWPVQ